MFNHRLTPYIVAIGVLVLFSLSYVGYRIYQNHVDFDEFMSQIVSFQQSSDKNTLSPEYKEGEKLVQREHLQERDSLLPIVKVGRAEGKVIEIKDIEEEDKSEPLARFSMEEMVKQRVQTPDGKIHTIYVPLGHEVKEGDLLSESYFNQPPPFNFKAVKGGRIRKSDIPEGESIESYTNKLFLSQAYGVSIEEIERMMERGDVQTKSVEKSPVEEFIDDEHLFHEHEPLPRSGATDTVSSGGTDEDTGDPPARSDVPRSPSDLSHVGESTPSSQSMTEIEKQLTPQEIERELSEGLSSNPFDKAQQFIDQYGIEEGLRRLREMDPEAARRFELEQRNPPTRDTSDDAASTQ